MNREVRRRDLLIRYTAPQRGTVVLMALLVLAGIAMALVEPYIVRFFVQPSRTGHTSGRWC